MSNNQNTYSSDNSTTGIWRAKILKDLGGGRAIIYIPSLHKNHNPFKMRVSVAVTETGEAQRDSDGNLVYDYESTTELKEDYEKALNPEAENEKQLSQTESSESALPYFDVVRDAVKNSENMPESSTMRMRSNDTAYVWNYFMGKIKNEYGVAALMGNLQAESGLCSHRLQSDFTDGYKNSVDYTRKIDSGQMTEDEFVYDTTGGGGYGLAQWTDPSRKRGLFRKSKQYDSIGSIELACDYLWDELQGSYSGVLETLQKATSIRAASDTVLFSYENPADKSTSVQESRASGGRGIYEAMTGKEYTATDVPGNPVSNSGGGASGNYSSIGSSSSSSSLNDKPLFSFPTAVTCVWQVGTKFNVGDSVWVMFENGNVKQPVIVGQFGTVLGMPTGKIRYDRVANTPSVDYSGSSSSSSSTAPAADAPNAVGARDDMSLEALPKTVQQYLTEGVSGNMPAHNWGGTDNTTQCVELTKHYMQSCFGIDTQYAAYGHGKDFAANVVNRHSDKFESVKVSDGGRSLSPGDVVSVRGSGSGYGHSAIVASVNGDSITFIEQWSGSGNVRTNTTTFPLSGYWSLYSAARPK